MGIFNRKGKYSGHIVSEEWEEKEWESHGPIFSRTGTNLPQLSELQVVRHYVALSRKNYGVDNNFYPLGSCTMKYNPKINEKVASIPSFSIHPNTPEEYSQGNLRIIHDLESLLCALTGMDGVSLQPAAGAHGELTGLMLIKKHFECKGKEAEKRKKIIIPDSAHGTNPASASLCGFEVVNIPSKNGLIDLDELKGKLDEETAGVMITNPNTLGIFEEKIVEIADLVHSKGALLYGDGANMNAMLGIIRPGDLGFDVIHLNLHKTFSTPHGGGGPGSGPVCVKKILEKYLPIPRVKKKKNYYLDYGEKDSIGKVKTYYGNFLVCIKALAYILSYGNRIRDVAEYAVLNANYLRSRVSKMKTLQIPYDRICAHEFVASPSKEILDKGIHTMDIAKRLIDYGVHPPTIYFPLIVKEAIMIEPNETEDKKTLDDFIGILGKIMDEALENPVLLHSAPNCAPVGRLDGVKAAREPILKEE